MPEHPLLMNDREVKQVLIGAKTHFVRTLSPGAVARYNKFDSAWQGSENLAADWDLYVNGQLYQSDCAPSKSSGKEYKDQLLELSPYGSPGDIVWVRETHFAIAPKIKDPLHRHHEPYDLWIDGQVPARADKDGEHVPMGPMAIVYRASGKRPWHMLNWRPSFKMWRWACRIEMRIEDVRLVRLQSIDHDEAMRQGIVHVPGTGYAVGSGGDHMHSQSAVGAFAAWWDEMCMTSRRRASWNDNPWVWIYSFSVDIVRSGVVKIEDLSFKEIEYGAMR